MLIKFGDKGDNVERIQNALKDLGYALEVDGDFGNQTDQAVRQFQEDNGLEVDGIVGEDTLTALGLDPETLEPLDSATDDSSTTFTDQDSSGISSSSSNGGTRDLPAAKKVQINKVRQTIPTGPGVNLVDITDDVSVIRGRILIANFDVNSSELKLEASPALEDVAAAMNSSPDVIGVFGLGSTDPIVDSPEKEEQLNRSVRLVYQIPLPQFVKTQPPPPEPVGSKKWAVRLVLSGGAGHAGIGGAGALGELKNLKTGEVKQGSFQGGGLGFGLQTPGGDPGFGDWVEFETDDHYTFDSFDGTLARLTMTGAGIAIIGYCVAYLSFPLLGANSIYVGGWNMGAFGIDGSTNVGWWNVIGL
jgi:hypothetical protein